jgi:hypothetical protein
MTCADLPLASHLLTASDLKTSSYLRRLLSDVFLMGLIIHTFAQFTVRQFEATSPRSYLGYKECCVELGIAPADADLPWGRLLQLNGLNDLNDWTKRHDLPRVSGLIVNQSGERQFWPGGDYFASNGRPDMDGHWWENQAFLAIHFDWNLFL